ncbi:MAG: serine/threonine protein kinase [Nannocystis sp.]|nr:serine/threonine-protein kinase [Nannocystis sp.]MBA3546247.1 serine/threonine protein kinase [Nannocystis sp.]
MPANRSNSAAATDTLIGQTIGGQYTLQRFLGHGSKARVFLATHRTLHRSVVLHLLSVPWADDSAAVAKFEEQARALRGLEHPNIAAVIDFGREPGRVFVVGEFVEGNLLDVYVQSLGRLNLEAFVPIAAQILKGLGATHARGLVHRDLKPTNVVLVEEQGRANYVKILDLGLAQILEGPPRGDDAPVVGTPAYLAPEQIMNKAVDARTDVYALGVMFYQMLSGKLPFVGDAQAGPMSVLYKHVNDKPIPLTQALPPGSNLPEGLIELVHDCLAKNPDNRPGDANEIVERLIDSVPAALFRLPIAGTSAAVRAPTGELPRTPTGDHKIVQQPRNEPTPQHDRALAAALEASGLRAIPDMEERPAPASPSGSGSGSWILGVLALLLTSGLVYVYFQNPGTPVTANKAAEATPVADPPVPEVPVMPEALERGLAKARELEQAGKVQEAIVAYEVVIAAAPEHGEARERIAALRAMLPAADTGREPAATTTPTLVPSPTGDTATPVADTGDVKHGETAGDVKPTGDVKPGETAGDVKPTGDVKPGETAGDVKPPVDATPVKFLVEASSRAEVFVDGVSKGKTPLTLELPAGTHKFELKAVNFLPHVETIEVAVDGQKSLKAKLVRKSGGGSSGINRAEEDAASAQLDPDSDAPTTKIEIKR